MAEHIFEEEGTFAMIDCDIQLARSYCGSEGCRKSHCNILEVSRMGSGRYQILGVPNFQSFSCPTAPADYAAMSTATSHTTRWYV